MNTYGIAVAKRLEHMKHQHIQQFSPTIARHVSHIAQRGDKDFAKDFLAAQQYSSFLHEIIERSIDAICSEDPHEYQSKIRRVPFAAGVREYHTRKSYISSPNRFRKSSMRSYTS